MKDLNDIEQWSYKKYKPEFWVSVSGVELQPLEKVKEQFLFFQSRSPVKHPGIILNQFYMFWQAFQQYLKESAMVVNIEEILSHLKLTNHNLHFLFQQSHPWNWLLALNVIALLGAFRKASYQ